MVQVCGESVECKVSAERMWHGLFVDAHNCLPKALPHHIAAVEYPHGQEGFHLPGHERLIKLRKGLGVRLLAAICEEVRGVEKHITKEAELLKEAAEEVEKHVQAQEKAVTEKAGEVVEKVEVTVKEAHKELHEEGEAAEKKAEKAAEEAVKAVEEAAKKEAEKAAAEAEKELNAAEKKLKAGDEELHKEAAAVEHNAAAAFGKAVSKEEAILGGAFHKVDAFLEKEELWVKEKIEEVEHEACKIRIAVLAGGLVGGLLKHCTHTFHFEHAHPASVLHWTCEFETFSSSSHYLHAFPRIQQHALFPFHAVAAFLLEHKDYI